MIYHLRLVQIYLNRIKMNNNNFPFVIVSAVLIVVSIALFYFLVLPQFEKISTQEKEIVDLEYKLENTTNYFNNVKENAQKLEELEWENVSKKIDANFMDGPFFIHNMEAYFKNLIVRSGLYLKDLTIEGASETYEAKEGEEAIPNTTENKAKAVNVSFDLSGDYSYFRNLLDIFDKQALVIKITNIEIGNSSNSEGMTSEGGEMGQGEPMPTTGSSNLGFQIKASISSK